MRADALDVPIPPPAQPRSDRHPRSGLRVRHLTLLMVMTHAPVVLAWSTISASYQIGAVVATPLVFLIAGLLMLIIAIGYSGMARRVHDSGGLYAFITHGLGRTPAFGAAAVLLCSYVVFNGVTQTFAGIAIPQLFSLLLGIRVPEVFGALAGLCLAVVLAFVRLRTAVRVLVGLAVAQVAVLGWLDSSALGHPAGGTISSAGLEPGWLLSGSFGLALCLALTSYIGAETGVNYASDVHRPQRTIPIATALAVLLTTGILLITSWALSVAAGPERAASLATLSGDVRGFNAAATLVTIVINGMTSPQHLALAIELMLAGLFLGSVASTVSLNTGTARLITALAADRALPAAFGSADPATPSVPARLLLPLAGGAISTVILVKGASGLLLPLALAGGLGVLVVICVASVATATWYLRRDDVEAGYFGWEGQVAAASVGAVTTACMFLFACARLPAALDTYTDLAPGWAPLAFLAVTVLAGLLWSAVHRVYHPAFWARSRHRDVDY